MKPLLSVLALVLTATTVAAQQPRVYSRPAVPPREALERLNLVLAWSAYVPVESMRDGLYSIQVTDRDVLVQTRAGIIASLDPETGRTRWRTLPGVPYRDKHRLGYNSRLVFAGNGTHLYCFDRGTGAQLWSFDLPSCPVAAPVADEEQLYVPVGGNRLDVYLLAANPPPAAAAPKRPGEEPAPATAAPASMPTPAGVPPAPPPELPPAPPRELRDYLGPYTERMFAGREHHTPPPLALVYEQLLPTALNQAPALTPAFVLVADTRGTLYGLSKFQQREVFHYDAGGPISAPFGQLGETAYVASLDQNLYALDLTTGQVVWHFTTPTPVHWKPDVTETEVYLSAAGSGLHRLARDSGYLVWRNTTADRFLAVNPKFVYATDGSGRLVILDRRRGTLLSGYDTHDYTVPVNNDLTDRVYLAANDGLVICLHDREYPTPVATRRPPAPPQAPGKAPPPKPAGKPPAEKPKEPADNPPAGADKDK